MERPHRLDIEAVIADHLDAKHNLLDLYTQVSYVNEAVDLANKVLADAPDDLPALHAKYVALYREHKLDDALHVSQMINELDPSDRLILALRFEDERPVREIARIVGLPSVFHVYRRVANALSIVRRGLARRGVEDAEP